MTFTHVAGRKNMLGKTWIDPEELAYPAGSIRQSRRKGLVRFPDGKYRMVTLGVADTFFTVPARASNGRHGYVSVPDFDDDGNMIPEDKREYEFRIPKDRRPYGIG